LAYLFAIACARIRVQQDFSRKLFIPDEKDLDLNRSIPSVQLKKKKKKIVKKFLGQG